MIVEIRDMPNQNIKSVDIHIDFSEFRKQSHFCKFFKKE